MVPLFDMANYDGVIRLFGGVPFPRDGSHTVWFRTPDDEGDGSMQPVRDRQRDWLYKHFGKYEWRGAQFNRVTDGVVRVGQPFENLDDINYIALKNVANDSRWHYGFVDKVAFVNSQTTEIHYTLDPLQCYQDAVGFTLCYIERTHVTKSDDVIGRHTVPEGLEIGPYQYQDVKPDRIIQTPKYVEVPYDNPEDPRAKTAKIDGWKFVVARVDKVVHPYNYMGTPVKLNAFETFVELNDYLKKVQEDGKTEEIVDMYMCPEQFLQENELFPGEYGEKPWQRILSIHRPTDINGYTPKNKKLFTYPYMFCQVFNNAGNSLEYKYELSKDTENPGEQIFQFTGSCLPGSKPTLTPRYQKTGVDRFMFAMSISLTPLPGIPVPTDAYQAWLAQNKGSNAVANLAVNTSRLNVVSTAVGAGNQVLGKAAAGAAIGSVAPGLGTAAGAVTGAVIGGGISVAQAVNSAYVASQSNAARYQDAQAKPDYCTGLDAPDMQYATGNYEFTLCNTCITKEYAEIVDDFFTRFGYKLNRLQKPNPYARDRFVFIKAPDERIRSLQTQAEGGTYGIPNWCVDAWQNALSDGLTLWHYNKAVTADGTFNMFNYDLSNN